MPGSSLMESSPFLLLFLLGYCLAMIEGELRCYCNESGCVATGYMCKSSVGKCFTAVDIRGEVTHLTHGCLDSVPEEHQRSCRVGVDVISASKADWATGHLPLLLCCTEHMCNYRDDIDISIILTPKFNGTFHRGRAPPKEDSAIYSRNHYNGRDEDRDLWFKAAVIAVPIAGGFILVLLVLLAVRMLRTDIHRHRRLIQIRRERSLTKAHVYISEHFSGKSIKQNCSLFNGKTNTTCVPLYSDKTATSNINNRSSNHRNSSVCQSSYFSDISNNYYINSQPKENTPKPESFSAQGMNLSSMSLPCSLNHNNTSHVTCSMNCDSHVNNSRHVKPCYIDSPTKDTSLARDIRLNKDGDTFHMASKMASSRPYSGYGHQHSFVTTLEDACENGSAAIV